MELHSRGVWLIGQAVSGAHGVTAAQCSMSGGHREAGLRKVEGEREREIAETLLHNKVCIYR